MKKLLVTLSILTSSLLMANLSPEFSGSVDSLKAQYQGEKPQKRVEKVEKKSTDSSFTSGISNLWGGDKKKEEAAKPVVYERDVKIIKVLQYSEIQNYQTSHKLLKRTVIRGSVTKTTITQNASKIKAKVVLIYVQDNIRYIHYFAN